MKRKAIRSQEWSYTHHGTNEQTRKETGKKSLEEIIKTGSKKMLRQMENHTNLLLGETRNAVLSRQAHGRQGIVNGIRKYNNNSEW